MIFDMKTCGACRTCEIACSFHHTGEFTPAAASIRILEKPDGHGYSVLLLEEPSGLSKACDGCTGLDEPLCMEVCREKEELEGMIRALLQKNERTKAA